MHPRYISALKRRASLALFALRSVGKPRFECPVCRYRGPFRDAPAATGLRRHARCPSCNALERHRIQYLVMERLLARPDLRNIRMLHVAPEPFLADFFRRRVASYTTADLNMAGVDHRVDLCALPFADASFDLVFASHVLEHVPDDRKAVAEIRRILSPSGIAVLPVPLVAERTIEYPAPNPVESGHVRAPGADYFDRYLEFFSKVDLVRSADLPEEYQLFLYEDRTEWPPPGCPLLRAMPGDRHADVVPVCYV